VGRVNTTLQFLTHRLEWPVCRVRREAAFELARLIREGMNGAADALLGWIHARDLESEVAIGISIIHAFDLGQLIPIKDVIAAVRAPSFLSDLLLQATYINAPDLSSHYGFERSYERPNTDNRSYFERNQGQLIGLRFKLRLSKLKRASGFPFFDRWFVEWAALQARYGAPFSGRPHYIWADAPREDTANVQVRQTEVFISAYLRTLAYAVAEWGMPASRAVNASLEALPFCQGLATVRPIDRPKWSFASLKISRANGVRTAAEKAWRSAERSTPAGQKVLALLTTDHDELGILRLTLRRVLVPAVAGDRPPPGTDLESAPRAVVDAPLAMTGPLVTGVDRDLPGGRFLSANILPYSVPRMHTDFVPVGIELAHPDIFSDVPLVVATSDSLMLETRGMPVSEWRHWYADWKPTYPNAIAGYAGYLSTINARELAKVARQSGLVLTTVCQADYGVRKYGYEAASFETERFWI
jgi:hypothetical protein